MPAHGVFWGFDADDADGFPGCGENPVLMTRVCAEGLGKTAG